MSGNDLISALKKTLPIIIEEHSSLKKANADLQQTKETLSRKVTFWRTNLWWLACVSIFLCGFLIYIVFAVRHSLSDKETEIQRKEEALNIKDTVISNLKDSMSDMSDKLKIMSEKLETMSDKLPNTEDLSIKTPKK